MKKMIYALGFAALLASCSSAKTEKEEAQAEEAAAAETEATVEGQWKLVEYVSGDKTVKVAEDKDYVATFEPADSTFGILTDCNNIGGKYVVEGANLKFDNLFSTRMMCPETQVEDAMNAILPTVEAYSIADDTLQLKAADNAVVATFAKYVAPDEATSEE